MDMTLRSAFILAMLVCLTPGCAAQRPVAAAPPPIPEIIVHDVCWYMWSDSRNLALCRTAQGGDCATVQDESDRSFCKIQAQSFAKVKLEEMEHPPDPTQQRLQELEDKISNQQMEIDEARRRASDAESETWAIGGMMLNNSR
jgi:hypothetical protein